ncbi:MAG TPA: TetR/AcrR family transcriptional regulator [Hanamia sp.]|nr:TetR/AcrR family transcriptional regulator [Hanamia sp.]
MAEKVKTKKDFSTEERIKKAARKVFMQKGYAATRTRDIAEESGINLALLNYYFRSKEKLFHEVMMEKIQQFFGALLPIIDDPSTKLESKIELMVSGYIDMLSSNPDLPLFVLSEMRNSSDLKKILPVQKITDKLSFIQQLKEKRPDVNPIQFLMTIIGMIVFPFIAQPAFELILGSNKTELQKILQQRKKLIPMWVKAMLKAK